jgi:hypothetical protein
VRLPRKGDPKPAPDSIVAAEDAGRYSDEAVSELDRAVGVEWYEHPGNEADLAALTLCRLRRARAGEKGGPRFGDEAVRLALTEASPDALVWIASRAISYMDENGFPEAIEPWAALREKTPEDLD